MVLAFFVLGCLLPEEQIEQNNGFLAVTVLKRQEIKAVQPTGGLKEIEKYVIPDTNYPAWDIILPLVSPRITQNYHTYHYGIDLVSDFNTSMFAVYEGVVIEAGWQSGYGNRIEIDHGNGFVTTYSHLSKFNIIKGDEVHTGDIIGTIGSTGNSTSPHLHFEIIYNKIKINPKLYLN